MKLIYTTKTPATIRVGSWVTSSIKKWMGRDEKGVVSDLTIGIYQVHSIEKKDIYIKYKTGNICPTPLTEEALILITNPDDPKYSKP